MTDEQINIAIAEVLNASIDDNNVYLVDDEGDIVELGLFTSDLNAMQIAQLTLKGHDRTVFRRFLHQEVMDDPDNQDNAPEFATVRQRAEAFLRTLGKWEEPQP